MKIKDFKKDLQNEEFNIPNVLDKVKPTALSASFTPVSKKRIFSASLVKRLSMSFCLILVFTIGIIYITNITRQPGYNKPDLIFDNSYGNDYCKEDNRIPSIVIPSNQCPEENNSNKEPESSTNPTPLEEETIIKYYYASLDDYILNSPIVTECESASANDFLSSITTSDDSSQVASPKLNDIIITNAITDYSSALTNVSQTTFSSTIKNADLIDLASFSNISYIIAKNETDNIDQIYELIPNTIKETYSKDELIFVISSIKNN